MNRKHINDYSSIGWCFDMRSLIKALEDGDADFIQEYLGPNSPMRQQINDVLAKLKELVEKDLSKCEEKHRMRQEHIKELHSKFERGYVLAKELEEILDSLNKDLSITGNENEFYYRWLDVRCIVRTMSEWENTFSNKIDPEQVLSFEQRSNDYEI